MSRQVPKLDTSSMKRFAFKDLTGQVFGTRRVLRRATEKGATSLWWVRCSLCDRTYKISAMTLWRGTRCKCICTIEGRWQLYERLRRRGLTEEQIDALEIGAPVTLGQLLALAGEGERKTPVLVRLVGEKGYAVTRVKQVTKHGGRIFLVAELPTTIRPWTRKRR